MNRKICRFGILGTAGIARKIWKAIGIADNAVVAAVASRSKDRAAKFIGQCESEFPACSSAWESPLSPNAIGSYEALINDPEVDAVYIPLPTTMRKQYVIAAALAGKHVLCEKPAAVHADDLVEMIDACQDAGVQFIDGVMFNHSLRYQSLLTTLRDQKPLGKLFRVQTHFSFPGDLSFQQSNIRVNSDLEPHGCLGDLGWYCIRFALGISDGTMPDRISMRALTHLQGSDSPGRVPGELIGELEFAGGLSAGFYCSFLSANQQTATISGDQGYLMIDDFVLPFYAGRTNYSVYQHDLDVQNCRWNFRNRSWQECFDEYPSGEPGTQEVNMIERLANIVNTGQVDRSWHQLSLSTQRIIDACRRSDIAGGTAVEIA